MGTQYSEAASLPSAAYRDFILSHVGLFDHYVIYQSGQYEYTGYVWNKWGKKITIQITRSSTGTGYNNRWSSSVIEGAEHYFTITEPMYCYSTESNYGSFYVPQTVVQTGVTASCVLLGVVVVWLAFRSVWKK